MGRAVYLQTAVAHSEPHRVHVDVSWECRVLLLSMSQILTCEIVCVRIRIQVHYTTIDLKSWII